MSPAKRLWVASLVLLVCLIQISCMTVPSGLFPQPSFPEKVRSTSDRPQQLSPASLWERKRFPVECATPAKFNLAQPNWRTGLEIQEAYRSARNDPRFTRAETLVRQGLIDAAHTSLLALLCEWPGVTGKREILQALVENRDAAGDQEAAVWFAEKGLAVLEYSVFWLYQLPGEQSKTESEQLRRGLGPTRIALLLPAADQYARLGDGQKAREKISDVQSILNDLQTDREGRSILEKGSPPGMTYLRLARIYILAGDMVGSREMLRKWEEETRKPSARRFPTSAFLNQLSSAYAEAGEYAEAKKWAEAALKGSDESSKRLRPFLLRILGRAAIAEGNGAAALQYLEESLRELPGAFSRLDVKGAWWFGQAYALAGKPQEATTKFLEAVGVIENLRGFVSADDRLAFFGKHSGPYHSLVESLLTLEEGPEKPSWKGLEGRGRSFAEIAFYYAEATRARLLSEQISRSRAGSAEGKLPPEMAQRERDLLGRADAELRSGVPYEDSAAYREVQAFVENLRSAYPDYATLKYPIPVTASQVPLGANEAVLAYSLLDRAVAVWLLQRGQEPRVFRIPVRRERVLEAIRDVRASLEPDSGGSLPVFNSQASGDLYQWLLAEPLKWTPRGTRIIVIPDSALGTIPFEVLTVRGGEGAVEFAGRRNTFAYAPSATVLAHQRRYRSPASPASPVGRLLAVGDPVYDESDPRARKTAGAETGMRAVRETALRDYSQKLRLGVFSRLPWTGQEAKQVASALRIPSESPDVRLGTDADEHDIKALDLTRYRYLHFATHGVLAEDLPYLKQPALVFSQIGDLKGEDGFLTMEEVLNLKLDADLTVLSACQTGLGREVSGEGVVGLMRAFLYAGSRSVLVSLWRVEDESTSVLMGKFYEYVAQGLPSAEALNRAKQDLRMDRGGRFAHPFYWAAFILFGSD